MNYTLFFLAIQRTSCKVLTYISDCCYNELRLSKQGDAGMVPATVAQQFLTRRERVIKMAIFGCAATCMDGRIQAAGRKHLKSKYGADWVDPVTHPGINKFLAEANVHVSLGWLIVYCLTLQIKKVYKCIILGNIRKMIGISVLDHGAKVVAIVGHPQCAGNKCDKDAQITHLVKAKKVVQSFGFEVPVILLWVCEDWKTVEIIGDDSSTHSIHSYNVYVAKP